jgi:hypothetical protein
VLANWNSLKGTLLLSPRVRDGILAGQGGRTYGLSAGPDTISIRSVSTSTGREDPETQKSVPDGLVRRIGDSLKHGLHGYL